MITVTNRIATITIDGSETVKFNPIYPVIAVKGDSITATLIKGIDSDAAEGIYSTSDGNGYTIIDNHTMADTLYLMGTGDVRIWGGTDATKCPFV